MPTNKQCLLMEYEELLKKGIHIREIILCIAMPSGETEIIVNPNVANKIEYIKNTYDDNLVHPSNENIYIDSWKFVEGEPNTYSFGQAIAIAKEGAAIARKNWNGPNQFVYYVGPNKYKSCTEIGNAIADEDGTVEYRPYLALKTVDGSVATWVPSISDVLAEDWYVIHVNEIKK